MRDFLQRQFRPASIEEKVGPLRQQGGFFNAEKNVNFQKVLTTGREKLFAKRIAVGIGGVLQNGHRVGRKCFRRSPKWHAKEPRAAKLRMKQRMRERETAHGIAECGNIKACCKLQNGEAGVPALTASGHEILECEKKGIASRQGNLRRAIHRRRPHQTAAFLTAAAIGETNCATFWMSSADFPCSPMRRTMALPTTTASDSFATAVA